MKEVKTLRCPAKLNLFLEIRGKRADEYHELGTLFAALDFGDTLRAEPWHGLEVTGCEAIPGPAEQNLIHKAARLLQTRYPGRAGAGLRFTLEKRIPLGAGLGGGSSDAASALRLANALWKMHLTSAELLDCAAALGSDVPFFLFEPFALAEGRGEILRRAPAPFPFYIVVATPACHVDTAWAYGRFQGRGFGQRWPDFQSAYAAQALSPSFYSKLHNDFEAIVMEHYPEIATVRQALNRHGPEKTLLTGSGASLFALFREEPAAQACLAAVQPQCRFAVLTRFIAPRDFFATD